jgi:hypothetical protein
LRESPHERLRVFGQRVEGFDLCFRVDVPPFDLALRHSWSREELGLGASAIPGALDDTAEFHEAFLRIVQPIDVVAQRIELYHDVVPLGRASVVALTQHLLLDAHAVLV